MRLVIDANCLRAEKPMLAAFLGESRQNIAVLTDFTGIEMHKGTDGLYNLRRSLEVLRSFPKQVLVLKSSVALWRMKPRSKGLVRRFTDDVQTRQFAEYVKQAERADSIDWLRKQTLEKVERANAHLKTIEAGLAPMRQAMLDVINGYTEEDLKILRTGESAPKELILRLVSNSIEVARSSFAPQLGFGRVPEFENMLYSIQFRSALAIHVLTLLWGLRRGLENVKDSKLRNDFVDSSYVAFGTFFDGVMSEEKRVNSAYALTRVIVEGITSRV